MTIVTIASAAHQATAGWAFSIDANPDRTFHGILQGQTHNAAIIIGMTRALEECHLLEEIRVQSNSSYLINTMSHNIRAWMRNEWRRADNQPIQNSDLWRQLSIDCRDHRISWHFIRTGSDPELERLRTLLNDRIGYRRN